MALSCLRNISARPVVAGFYNLQQIALGEAAAEQEIIMALTIRGAIRSCYASA